MGEIIMWKHANKIRWLLIGLLVALSTVSAIGFLFVRQVPVHIWLVMNPCAPTSFYIALVLILDKNRYSGYSLMAMNAAVPFLLYLGIDGLLTFSWALLLAQVQHIFMVFTASFILGVTYYSVDDTKFRKLMIGLAVGIIALIIFLFVIVPIILLDPLAQIILESYLPQMR
jgi:hypothetical protein